MNPIVFHIISGQAFFTGSVLVMLAAWLSTRESRVAKRVMVLVFLLGMIAIVVSSTSMPYWFYGCAGVITLVWISSCFVKKWRRWSAYAVIGVWAIAIGLEAPYHLTPTIKPVASRSMTVIGDSVTAGLGGGDKAETWPQILARKHDLQVQDISHVGDTVSAALKRVQKAPVVSPIVLLAIGGNDILGSTTTEQFAKSLEALLAELSAPDRQLIMLELPLPPFYHEYGRTQRNLAQKYDVALVPKRVFLSIIARGESTLDSIHLSEAGHQTMAEVVWGLVMPAYATD
ncbi:SGNH/GDSL hydrolase family protein [Gimesia aquarii]|uniref:Esterase TesA n=1 Tax=Gimesia aquarii TaxID=2527964 RepID=A0A517X122_9PLAN|nr:GDSL-type esterase/lipase family protein [Gimesia aquarii]QDU11194.1 Esterase TesA precursor [Gimesia aquarii]